ncbi:hypothetical protein T4B_3431 [Trichinella pseudospiralis]|uniref:Uncharacterized protein n=2 Tax=Trichinella pseudospiralis TaxID=6337 RepID=A0A0V1FRQ6_TRIPS|nr:hypothetical protein T4A_13777 [Trichinella pseudospiralis]KRY88620.1 hypothetical protein T4D_14927 [Trichinella pseudospiralis]KRZ32549.1 hypothetical protein T4B_3431 [Trichinella pseudospiralis]KRZ40886.1 hypothetical protein T4C_8751 [Trichinella pseudospiralis]
MDRSNFFGLCDFSQKAGNSGAPTPAIWRALLRRDRALIFHSHTLERCGRLGPTGFSAETHNESTQLDFVQR